MERYISRVGKVKVEEVNSKKFLKVAAYVRVSTSKDAMLHSLASQVSYYQTYIQAHDNYKFAGIFSDEGISGTKAHRPGFDEMIAKAKAGNINLIITKSISRFARNTVTLLETIRDLKAYGVDVYFEEQNIHTLSAEGELMITILASYAQEESRSASENLKWRIRKNFEEGKAWNTSVLGYKLDKGVFHIIPEEAVIVKRIYDMFLKGNGTPAIAKELNKEGFVSKRGHPFNTSSIKLILTNYLYTGNLLLQRFYKNNHIDKKKMINKGELPKYHALDTHEAIIPLGTFLHVQQLMEAKRDFTNRVSPHNKSALTGKLVCANCGTHYRRKVSRDKAYWICGTYSMKGKEYCASKQIPEEILLSKIAEALRMNYFDEEVFSKKIEHIEVRNNNELGFYFLDNRVKTLTWQDKSRSLSWTAEMKEKARRKAIIQHHGNSQSYSSNIRPAYQIRT